MSVREAAERLSVNGRSIRRLVAAGWVPAVQIDGPGSAPASPLEALEAWLWADGDEAA